MKKTVLKGEKVYKILSKIITARFGGHRSCRNGYINSFINSYMNIFVLIHHITRFLKPIIPICNSKVSDKAGRKTTRRRTQTIAKRYAFKENSTNRTVNTLSLINVAQIVDQKIPYDKSYNLKKLGKIAKKIRKISAFKGLT